MSLRPFGLSLHIQTILLSLFFLSNATAAAPASCTFSCPTTDTNGRALITSRYSTPYNGPYSVFDCIYAIPGKPTSHPCRYYKDNGVNALGSKSSSCPTQAVPCSEDTTPRFSTPDRIEIPSYITSGNDLLYYREHPPTSQ